MNETLTLTPSERELLVRVLGTQVKEKRVEIHRTEFSRDFRRALEAEEALLQGMLDRLMQTPQLA